MSKFDSEQLKRLEMIVNSLFTNKGYIVTEITNNIEIYYYLSELILNNLLPCISEELNVEYSDFTNKNFFENIELIKGFYEKYNIKLNLEKLIKNGTIGYIDRIDEFHIEGHNYYKDEMKLVDSCNNGLIIDSIILIHELSHLRDQPDNHRPIPSDLLTEALAFTEELIFLDYLSTLGYENDALLFKKYLCSQCIGLAKSSISMFRLGSVFANFSNLSSTSYKLYFDSLDNYEKDLENLSKYPTNIRWFLSDSWYTLGYTLAIYMYYEFKKDNSFMDNIKMLHDVINTHDIFSCLKLMNLRNFSSEDFDKIESSIKCFGQDINALNLKKIPKGI